MASVLVITVRLHDGWYHGRAEWPPCPARLFQALVAGAGLSGPLSSAERGAFSWLECLEPPVVATPPANEGRSFRIWVPNNDLDSVAGDPRQLRMIRDDKVMKPHLIDGRVPFLYAWHLDGGEDDDRQARRVCDLAERLYQFGRSMDMGWAWGEVINCEEAEARLANHPGRIHRPSNGGNGMALACPRPGSLDSLLERHQAKRFAVTREGRTVQRVFRQPPKPRFAAVAYDSPPARRVYELRQPTSEAPIVSWPLTGVSALVVRMRDAAVERLRRALPSHNGDIERYLVGRKANGDDAGPASARVRIVPLSSIGHQHADRGIRRVLVEVPASCPLNAEDVDWAFSGVEPVDTESGEMLGLVATPAADESMLAHYGVGSTMPSRVWRTVTPAALSGSTRRCRDRDGRIARQGHAAAAVVGALRHAGNVEHPQTIRVQREPFDSRGERAEAFASGTRFTSDRLLHVEIVFAEPVAGPLVIGDGRFVGLGVMRPVRQTPGVYAWLVESGLAKAPEPTEVARALRRAVMARVQELLGPGAPLPTFFSGHNRDGSPARSDRCSHLSFLFAPVSSSGPARLIVIAPHVVEHREPQRHEQKHLQVLEVAMKGFRDLRTGRSGRPALYPGVVELDEDPLFAPARAWESVTPYQVNRHMKQVGATEALSADLLSECERRGLPRPLISPRTPRGVPGVGLVGNARLTFKVAVKGPILLGRGRHLGGGLFAGAETSAPGLDRYSA